MTWQGWPRHPLIMDVWWWWLANIDPRARRSPMHPPRSTGMVIGATVRVRRMLELAMEAYLSGPRAILFFEGIGNVHK